MLIDLHVHTSYGDDFEATLEEAITACRGRGISAVLLAECDLIPPLDEVQATASAESFKVFVGVDIDARDGRVIGVPRDPADERFQKQGWADGSDFRVCDVIEWFDGIDGATFAAHPYLDDGGPYLGDRVYDLPGLAGVEVACGVKDDLANDLALEAANTMGVPVVGGSDTGPEGQRLGHFATAFADEIETQEELVDALREGTFWAVEIAPAEMRRKPRRRGRGRGRPPRRQGGGGR